MRKIDIHTSRPPRTHSPIPRVIHIATDIPHPRIIEPLLAEILAEQVLHAPEASRGDGTFLRRVGDVGRAAFGGAEAHFRGRGEGPEEAGEEVGHEAGH